MRLLLLFLTLFLPVAAWAALFDVSAADKSMQYLGMIFGNVGDLPIRSTGNPIFSSLIHIFNQIVFLLGIVIIAFTAIMGTIGTAHEGEVMGKKMSSIWIPVRSGFGVYLLLPATNGGYNWIQVAVMWMIVQGVGAANTIWEQVIVSNATQGNVTADTRRADLENGFGATGAIFHCLLCMTKINAEMLKNPVISTNLGGEYLTPFPEGDEIQFGQLSKKGTVKPLCGSITIPTVGSALTSKVDQAFGQVDPNLQKEILGSAILSAQNAMLSSAVEAVTLPRTNWSQEGRWVEASRVLQAALLNLNDSFTKVDDKRQQAISNGWILAGSYYFVLVSGGNYTAPPPIQIVDSGIDAKAIRQILGATYADPIIQAVGEAPPNIKTDTPQGTDPANVSGTLMSAYYDHVKNGTNGSGGIFPVTPAQRASGSIATINLPKSNKMATAVFDAIFGGNFFNNIAGKLVAHVTTGCFSYDINDPLHIGEAASYIGRQIGLSNNQSGGGTAAENASTAANAQGGDPVVCMAAFGANLAAIIEETFWTAMILIPLLFIGAVCLGVQAFGNALQKIFQYAIPLIMMLIIALWSAGIMLALYVPLIPFLVFTFSAVSWMILVIEAMLGAPLIALTLIVPSEDEIGKAGHAIMILLGLFLRPALMIIGFIFSIQLLFVAITMLNVGFAGTLKMNIGAGMGPFGLVAVILMYVGIAVSFVHEAFSLIYVLPDKILRWLAGAGEGMEAGQQVKELKGKVSGKGSGSEIGSGFMQTGVKSASSMNPGGGGGGGGGGAPGLQT